jgi:RNA polymerase-interacting CarD/CdnL/TRCF family regulator
MFKQGDTISHARHGIGVIQSFQEQELLGAKSVYATLYFDDQGLQVTVAQNRLEQQVRPLMDEAAARGLMPYITDLKAHPEEAWKLRQKENHERLSSGDPLELCAVAKGLIRLRSQRPLAASDTAQLKRSLDLLSEEICMVLGGSRDQISRELEQACLASLSAN